MDPSTGTELPPSTRDTLCGGTIAFEQPADGYRAPVDGLLLADFAGSCARETVVDLGAGAGMVSLALLARADPMRLVAVERDPALAAFLLRNLTTNGFGDRAIAVCADVESAASSRRGYADVVVANPPFYAERAATPPRHPRTRDARIGRAAASAAASFLRAARAFLARGGRACFIWPSADLEPLLCTAAAAGLRAKRARFVHALPDREAHRVLIEFKPGRTGGLCIAPPLVLAERPGIRSSECARITG